MTGTKDLRARLERFVTVRGITAADKALSGINVDRELTEIDQVQRLLLLVPRSHSRAIYGAAVVGSACLILACVLWTVGIPRVHVQLVARSESIAITLAQDLNWSGSWDLAGGLLRLEDMSRI